jgi:hypothetical protein
MAGRLARNKRKRKVSNKKLKIRWFFIGFHSQKKPFLTHIIEF